MINASNNEYRYLPQDTLSNAQLLQVYLALCVIANFASVFFNGHGGDLGFWFNWITQLSNNGYTNFSADYPPMYIHWIYTVSKILPAIGTPLENNLLLKTLFELPAIGCHLLIVTIVSQLLDSTTANRIHRHLILLLTAFNPAILFNGPVWGQVDIIPVTFALIAILLHFSAKFRVLSIPFYIFSLLIKFQMICFAPIMGILFFRQFKANLIGILISVPVFVAAFLPFILQNDFVRYFSQAYINTLGQYAYTTFNASNLWMLISSNTMPDSYVMFTLYPGTAYALPVKAKYLGMVLFSLVSLLVFVRGLRQQITRSIGNSYQEASDIVFFAFLCALAFFTLLPAMHERYLFPAVVMSLAYAAINPKRIVYALAASLICFINMVLINGVNGSDVWLGLSILCVAALLFALLDFYIGRPLYIFLNDVLKSVASLRWLGFWTFLLGTLLVIYLLVHYNKVHRVNLEDNQMLLTDIPYLSATQSYGSLQINKSVDSRTLSVGNQRYANGLGTHTISTIVYELPAGAKNFSFIVGVDDESGGSSDMQFSVWGDGKKLWESPIYYGYETKNTVENVDITNIKQLTLRVDPVTSMGSDHADWINPIITFDHKVK